MEKKFSCVEKKLSCVEKNLSCVEKKLSCVEKKLSCVEKKLSCVEKKLSCVEKKLSCVEKKLSCVEKKLSCVEKKLSCVEKNLALLCGEEPFLCGTREQPELPGSNSANLSQRSREEMTSKKDGPNTRLRVRDRSVPRHRGDERQPAQELDPSAGEYLPSFDDERYVSTVTGAVQSVLKTDLDAQLHETTLSLQMP